MRDLVQGQLQRARRGCGPRSLFLALAAGMAAILLQRSSNPAADAPIVPAADSSRIALNSHDRVLVLAPHPDDEVLGCAGVLQAAADLGIPYRIVFLTNGEGNEWSFTLYRRQPEILPRQLEAMGQVRQSEARAAAQALGLAPGNEVFLGFPDFDSRQIWLAHWRAAPPYRSPLTLATHVPYADTLRPGAPHKGEAILEELAFELRDFRPTKVFVSHPADHNGDHEALYLFTLVALWDLQAQPGWAAPELFPYLIHYPRWPVPRALAPQDGLLPPARLADAERWQAVPLTADEVNRKLAALRAHATQYGANTNYLASFVRSNELFGELPTVELRGPAREHTQHARGSQPPEQLTDGEQGRFVGLESRTVRLERDQVIVTLHMSKPLGREASARVYLFGYRSDRPFAAMPKVRVQVGDLLTNAYDQKEPLARDSWQASRQGATITVSVPLATLGDPDRVLTGAQTTLGEVPLSTLAWRVLLLGTAQ